MRNRILTLAMCLVLALGCLGISACSKSSDSASGSSSAAASSSSSTSADNGSATDNGQQADQGGSATAQSSAISEDGTYDSKDEVALYIHTYGHLPSNYISKKEAQALGWEGGSLEPYAPGCAIGGDYFGNYEGLLPSSTSYHECDIDTVGASKRGAKRIIYGDDGSIYYTDDHYETFTQLY